MSLTVLSVSGSPEKQPKGKPDSVPGFKPKGERPTCCKCGCELRPIPVVRNKEGRKYPSVVGNWKDAVEVRYGYEGNGAFCTLRCGYFYALENMRR